jgi:hypothetical protein
VTLPPSTAPQQWGGSVTGAVTLLLAGARGVSAGLGVNRSSLAQVELAGEAVEVGGELAAVVVGPAGIALFGWITLLAPARPG